METERKRQIVLAVLALVLAAVIYREWPRTSPQAAASSNVKGSAAVAQPRDQPRRPETAGAPDAAAGGAQPQSATQVHLDALKAERPKPASADRNLFRFKPKAPPPPPPAARGTNPQAGGPGSSAAPQGPPPVAPITLKFIGIVEQGPGQPKIALLADQAGHVFRGSEGDTIEGRWRILHIGVESIEMAYLDGRGRQTIRLTGS